MKNIYILLIICTLAYACKTEKEIIGITQVKAIAGDLSDSMNPGVQYIKADGISSILNVTTSNRYDGADIVITAISDVHINPLYVVSIPQVKDEESDPIERDTLINVFKHSLNEKLQMFSNAKIGRKHSFIFASVALLLDTVASFGIPAEVRLVTDLHENSDDILSVYDNNQVRVLMADPEVLFTKLDKMCPIHHSLQKISIIVVYQAKYKDDKIYKFMFDLVREYYSRKGACVTASTSLF